MLISTRTSPICQLWFQAVRALSFRRQFHWQNVMAYPGYGRALALVGGLMSFFTVPRNEQWIRAPVRSQILGVRNRLADNSSGQHRSPAGYASEGPGGRGRRPLVSEPLITPRPQPERRCGAIRLQARSRPCIFNPVPFHSGCNTKFSYHRQHAVYLSTSSLQTMQGLRPPLVG